ncbi:site-specific integrase [Sebaldella sp. S0638]|uniref:tyrosine-type recombinase/integrase n=1 Tax=Sebaldella sp. S0638 TaxID=2957809 RepID=UPI00209FA93C|nr:site-specific integrase [Sebaldella sp. S0638]MCP1226607.1 site-specific integrase [Sebaldella sp. S0638]
MSDFLDEWYNDYVLLNCKHNTQLSYLGVIRHLKNELGKYKLKTLTPLIIQDYINKRFKNGTSTDSLKIFKAIFKSALKYAIFPCKYINQNPLLDITIPKTTGEIKKIETLTPEQFEILLGFIKKNFYKLAFLIAFHTGMRVSEICALLWENINFEKNTISVKYNLQYYKGICSLTSTKSNSSYREISFGNTLKEILIAEKEKQVELKKIYDEYYYKNYDFVICRENGSPIPGIYISNLCQDLEDKGLPFKFNFHMLRHTHATLLLEAGANIIDVSKRLGHKKISTTLNRYSHATKKMTENTVNLFEKILK